MINNSIVILFLIYIALLILLFLIGKCYYNYYLKRESLFTKTNSALIFGEKILFGSLIFLSVSAVIYSQFITSHLLIFILLVVLPFLLKKELIHIKQNKISLNEILLFASIGIIIFITHSFFISYLPDHLFYSKLSNSILLTGKESISSLYSSYLNDVYIDHYHYSDLWLSGITARITGVSNLFILTKVIYPFYHFLLFTIFLGLVKNNIVKLKHAIIITSLLIYGSVILFVPLISEERGHYLFWFYGIPDITSFKSLVIYPVLTILLFMLDSKRWELVMFFSSIACIQYVTLVIPIISGILLFTTYYVLIKKQKDISLLKSVFVFIIVMAIYILLPSKMNDTTSNSSLIHLIKPISYYFTHFIDYAITFIDYFSRPFIFYPLVSIFLIIIFIMKIKLKLYNSFLFVLFSFFSTSIIISLFFDFRDITQALSIFIPPAMIYCTIKLFFILKKLKFKKVLLAISLIIAFLNLTNLYSYNSTNIKLSGFDLKLYKFAKDELKHQNWAYHSSRYWSVWRYNSKILSTSLLLNDKTILPLEIAPLFDIENSNYFIKNIDYPMKINEEINIPIENQVITQLKEKKINYLYIEDKSKVSPAFLSFFKEKVTEGNKGIWKLKATN
jgi:hypothetical protein